MFNNKKNERFEIIYKESSGLSGQKIMVDKETGVHYLFSWDGYAGGITPLLDKEGKPVISKKTE